MYLLNELLADGDIISNDYGIINKEWLKARLKFRYGNRKLRPDLNGEWVQAAQNVIDTNHEYFEKLLSTVYNPYETYREQGTGVQTENGSDGGSNTLTKTGTETTTNTIISEGDSQTETTGTAKTTDNVFAYDEPTTSTPERTNDTENSGNNSNIYSDTSTGENTLTHNTTDKNEYSNTAHKDNNNSYTKSGYNITDYITALNAYKSAYDIIANMIALEICVCVGF